MAIYRFRVTFEDTEEVYREIEIKSTQNFEDFHTIILQSINFDTIHDSSFFISDDYWRKGEEITLRLMNDDKQHKGSTPKRLMSKCKMASLIDDPHQKFVYVYDPKISWTFLVELIKIVADDPKASYPKCAKSNGIAPRQYVSTTILPPINDEDDLEEEISKDDDAYILAHSEDETALLEGEEGEEGETEMEEEDNEMEEDEFDNAELEDHHEGNFEED